MQFSLATRAVSAEPHPLCWQIHQSAWAGISRLQSSWYVEAEINKQNIHNKYTACQKNITTKIMSQ